MKTTLLILLSALPLASCAATSVSREDVAVLVPESAAAYDADLARYDELEAGLRVAEAELAAANLTPDPADDAAAEARAAEIVDELDAVTTRLDAVDSKAIQRKLGPVAGAFDLLTPGSAGLGSTALALLLGWPTSRRRRLYGSALSKVRAGSGSMLAALGELLKAMGGAHTSEASKSAAEGEKTA